MNEADQAAALNFLGGLDLGRLLQAEAALAQGFITLGVPNPNQKTYRYQLRQMVDWLREQGWLPLGDVMPPKTLGGQPVGTFKDRYRHRVEGRTRRGPQSSSKQRPKPAYALRGDEISETLRAELATYRQFRRHLRPSSFEKMERELLQLLGWRHRFEGEPLECLTLAQLIPLIPMKPHYEQIAETGDLEEICCVEALLEQQQDLERNARQAAQHLDAMLNRYFEFQADCVATQHSLAQVMTNLAEFIYRDEMERFGLDRRTCTQLPIIKKLKDIQASRARLKRAKSSGKTSEQRSVPWRTVFQVLKAQQQKADEPYAYFVQVINGKEYRGRNKRPKTAIARDLQTFLMLLFFVALPPDRVQGIEALELGKSLIQGTFESGAFVPLERMADPKAAAWYIRLKANRYKTGATYGESWGLVPNVPLGQGRCFYDYLARWITEDRLVFEPDHDVLFVKTQNRLNQVRVGDPITRAAIQSYVKGAFSVYATMPIPPQTLRSMFVTYLNQVGASEAELEAAAAAMHHGRATQRAHYDRQDKLSKMQPILTLHQQLVTGQSAQCNAAETALPLTAGGWVDYRCLSDSQLRQLIQQLKRSPKETLAD
jgi:hypothetical protein